MKIPRFAAMIACLALPLVSGCATTGLDPPKTDAPIVWASTVGGCTEPTHQPYPEYGARVPYTGVPDPRKKVPPVYPEGSNASVSGTVVVAALVCEHGRVVATRIAKSIPMLDVAATNSVRQWEFQPAMIRGVRVAAWTTIPVTFTHH
jgi:TonB family protein